MIPNIFVSSTTQDLRYLREAIRETIVDLGYRPIMSDYGDIGYLPNTTAEESCYLSVRECQLAILIIGKRYSAESSNGVSVTHNEFRRARAHRIPIITLVERDIDSFEKAYDANVMKGLDQDFPGMDSPKQTFRFIQEVRDATTNNGILSFSNITDARQHLKNQMANLFGSLLNNQFNSITANVQDILSEIKTLRHELLKDRGPAPIRYLEAMRFLLEGSEHHREYRSLVQDLAGGLDEAVPLLLESETFDVFLDKTHTSLQIENEPIALHKSQHTETLLGMTTRSLIPDELSLELDEDGGAEWVVYTGKIVMNNTAKKYFDSIHSEFTEKTMA